MKKIFSILAAAVIALSFASCEKTDPGMKFFKLKATVTDTSVIISINPADTSVYYCWGCYPTSEVKKYTLDTLVEWDVEDLQWYVDHNMTLEQMVEDEYLYKGPFGPHEYTDIPVNFSFTMFAFEVLENNGELSIGRIATKEFTTKKIEVVDEIDLGTLTNGTLLNVIEENGFFVTYASITDANDERTAFIGLIVNSDKLAGSYTFQDLSIYQDSYVWTAEKNGNQYIVDAKFTVTYKESSKTGKVSGWVVCDNGIKYKFTYEYALALLGAPARTKQFVPVEKKDFKELSIKSLRK